MSKITDGQTTSRGALIVVEGLDRAGKSTQVFRLSTQWTEQLGRPAQAMRFPDRSTAIGENLNNYLTEKGSGKSLPLAAAHLLFSANRWETAATLRESIEAGNTLVVDRYSYSGAVYTAAKAASSPDDADRAMGLDWTWSPEVGLPAPDLLLFLDISEEETQRRGGFGEERYETTDMQRAVRQTFYELLRRLQSSGSDSTRIVRVDANQNEDTVAADMWAAVTSLAHSVQREEMPGLNVLQPLPGGVLASE